MITAFAYSLFKSTTGKLTFSHGDKKNNIKYSPLGKIRFSVECKLNLQNINFYLSLDGNIYAKYSHQGKVTTEALKKVFTYTDGKLSFHDFKS